MRYVLAVIIFCFVLSFCVIAKASERCDTQWYSQWRDDVRERNPGAPIVESVLSDENRAEFVAAYNASPPQSNEYPSGVAVWVHMKHMQAHVAGQLLGGNTVPIALVVFIDDAGCIISTQKIPLFVMEKLLQGVPFIQNSKETNVRP
jgi:hypothetical protein